MKKSIQMLSKLGLIVLMIITMCLSTCQPVMGYDDLTPKEFTRVKEIMYPSWWQSKCPEIDKQWSTFMCRYDDKWTYCLEASKNTPASGTYPTEVIANNTMVRKLLYYGFGGPGSKNADGSWAIFDGKALSGDGLSVDETLYLYTHVLLSVAYSGDVCGADIDALEKLGIGLKGIYQAVENMPDPGAGVSFSPYQEASHIASMKAGYDTKTKQQKTNTVTFVGNSQATLQIPLQDGVTLHVENGNTYTNQAVLHGGESFYLTAPCDVSLDDYHSANIASTGCELFTALAIKTNGVNDQVHGTWHYDPDGSRMYMNVDWLDFGALRLSKVDNSSHFLKGSKFRLVSSSYSGFDEIYEVNEDEDGDYELMIDHLPVGDYILTEVDSDDYYVPVVATWQLKIEKDKTTRQIVVNTLRPVGTLDVYKSLETQTDNNVATQDIEKTYYQIVATRDIIDTVSLKTLYHQGDVITLNSGQCVIDIGDQQSITYSPGIQLIHGKETETKGIYQVDEQGHLQLDNFPLGSYQIKEVQAPDGYVVESQGHDFTFSQVDYQTTVYDEQFHQLNQLTRYVIKKSDSLNQPVVGATLQVIDDQGQCVDEWVTSSKDHLIYGLTAGKQYTLKETEVPLGYVQSQDVDFVVENTSEQQTVTMLDPKVSVIKTNEDGQSLSQASLQVIDKESQEVVDSWISGSHIYDFDSQMLELLNQGEVIETEDAYIQKVAQDYLVQLETGLYCVDENGNETKHYVRHLQANHDYILQEISAPLGYAKAGDIDFHVLDNQDMMLTMVDEITKVEVSKQDMVTGQELPGAHLQVIDSQGQIIEEWISSEEPHMIYGLHIGESYRLVETIAPQGYLVAASIDFMIEDTGEIQRVVMKDEVSIPTGDATHFQLAFVTMMMSSIVGLFLFYKRYN